MASNYHSSHCESDGRYPHTDRVVVGEDYVDFISQFVKDSNRSAKDCASTTNIRNNIIGTPRNFPKHGDFLLKKYGFDISISPWQKQVPYTFIPRWDKDIYYHYIDLEFHEAVYPIRVSIYETYNFGNVTEIWAQDSDNENHWFPLWNGPPQFYGAQYISLGRSKSRIFSPPLRSCNFKTKVLRLQFISNSCTQLDAVMLIGTSKLIVSKTFESLTDLLRRMWIQRHSCSPRCSCYSLQEQNGFQNKESQNMPVLYNYYSRTSDYENAHLDILDLQTEFSKYCVIYESDITSFHKTKQESQKDVPSSSKQRYVNHPLLRNNWNYIKFIEDINLSSGESKEQQCYSFSSLPDEIISMILKNLDMRSFCRMSTVNKRLNNLTQDSLLFKNLNLRNFRYELSQNSYICYDKMMFYFASKCKSLKQLDLTASHISVSKFINFINTCGKGLTHLRLSSCDFVDKSALLKISKICKNLIVLDLSYCTLDLEETDQEVLILENLEFLEILNLRGSRIRVESLCTILQKTRRLRDLNLGMASHITKLHFDAIAIQLKNSCPDLEIIDLSDNIITSLGIDALAECKNLRKLKMSPEIDRDINDTINKQYSLRRLFSSCVLLEEVSLIDTCMKAFHNNDFYEKELTLCKNVRQIHLRHISTPAILEQCPKLQTIYVLRCWYDHIGDNFIGQLKEKYPHVSIHKFQMGFDNC